MSTPVTSEMPSTHGNNISQAFAPASPKLDLTERVMSDYIQPAICVFGILCNLLNLLILTRPRLKESPYTYLIGVAVSDLGVLVTVFIGTVVSQRIGIGLYGWQIFNAFIFLPFANMFSNSSIWITVFLTIERWVSVKFPLKAKKYCTKKLARGIMVAVAIVMFLINIPRFFCRTIVQTNGTDVDYTVVSSSFERSDAYKIITWLYIVCILFIPCLILIVLNTCLLYVVYQANKNRSELNGTNENNIAVHISREQFRLTVTCASIICLFLVCVIPTALANPPVALALFSQDKAPEEFFQSSFYRILRIVTNTLLTFNLSLNFVLYCFFNQKFFKTLEHLVRAFMYRVCKIDFPQRDFQHLPRSLRKSGSISQGTIQGSPDNKRNCKSYRFSIICDDGGCRAGTNSQAIDCSVISSTEAMSHLIPTEAKDSKRSPRRCNSRTRFFDN